MEKNINKGVFGASQRGPQKSCDIGHFRIWAPKVKSDRRGPHKSRMSETGLRLEERPLRSLVEGELCLQTRLKKMEVLQRWMLHVAIAVVDLLQELTDIDTLHESEEGAGVLIDALVDGQVVALLVQNLERLDESVKEEADGVHNTLAIIENMAEFRPEVCADAAQQGLMQWLLKRLKPTDESCFLNLFVRLAVLLCRLPDGQNNREMLGELDGIDVLLQQLSVFKRHNPGPAEEEEMMENLFDSLCSSLMLSSNRDRFLKGEGLQLMNLMLR
ncbi:beta-catenin-like protein 1 [Notechis scutatus]|uniref:Beta-catenin-like protein 1 n=1 Tax=Notechis scutatus TaxID=8663 RepID=A0A6J1VVD1_9SAUR|nr:beta-catenin-like protein 1 [Notechis scutatus]